MLKAPTENLPLSVIIIHRLNTVVPIKNNVNQFCKIANISQRDLPLVTVGYVKEKYYLLSGIDVFHGVVNSRLDNIECIVINFESELDFLIKHVTLNKNPNGFNPLSLFPLVEYMKSNGITSDQIPGLLQIHDTIHEDIINQKLSPDAIIELSNIFLFLADKLTNPTIPFYLIKQIAKCDYNKQKSGVLLIKDTLSQLSINDHRFGWMLPEEIKLKLGDSDFHQEKEKSTVVIPDGEKPTNVSLKKAKDISNQLKHSIVIPATNTRPEMIVDTKTHDVKIVSEKDNIVKLESVDSKPVYMISDKVIESLDVTEESQLKSFKFTAISKLQSFLEKHPDVQGVLMYK